MALPNFTSDLVLLANAETYATDNSGVGGTWEIFGGSGGSSPGIAEDFAIEGTNSIAMKITSSQGRRGITFAPNTARALGTDELFYIWTYVSTNGILTETTFPAGTTPVGLCLFAGNSVTNNYYETRVIGNFREKGRSGECYGFEPNGLTSIPNGGESYGRTGTPASPWNNIGATAEFSANSKDANFAVDSIRQGTGTYMIDGEVANPGTFAGYETTSNSGISTKLGTVVEPVQGSYEIIGVLAIGINSSGVSETNTCVFNDNSGASILYKDLVGGNSANLRNKLIVGGSATTATFVSTTFTQIGTVLNSTAQVILKDSSLSSFSRCTFINMSNWTLSSTNTNNSFSTCTFFDLFSGAQSAASGVINASNGNFSFTDCLFNNNRFRNSATAGDSMLAAPLNKIQECTFETTTNIGASAHAVNAGTVSASTSYIWDSTAVTGTAVDQFAASDGSTGHEVIRINYTDTSAPLTIQYTTGATVPSVYNTGAGTVNVVAQQVNFELTSIKDATEIRIINASTNAEIAGVEDVTGGSGTTINNGSGTITVSGSTDLNTVNYAYTYSSDVAIKIAVINREEYEILYIQSTLTNANQSTQVFQREDRNFSDPV